MDRRAFIGVWALVASTALVGCGPPWAVVVQAAPDPFYGQRRFALMPIDFRGLRVGDKPESVWLAGKDAEQRASFESDKAAFNEKFLEGIRAGAREGGLNVVPATGPMDAPFIIQPAVPFIEPGFYVFVASQPSRVEMNVRILAPDGRILDEILVSHSTGADMINAASGSRLRADGAGLGAIVARYLRVRAGVGE